MLYARINTTRLPPFSRGAYLEFAAHFHSFGVMRVRGMRFPFRYSSASNVLSESVLLSSLSSLWRTVIVRRSLGFLGYYPLISLSDLWIRYALS
jgi:hypothetical protein